MKIHILLVAAVLGITCISCEDISYGSPGNQFPKVTTLPVIHCNAYSARLHGEAHCEDFESDYYRFFLLSEDENLSEYESRIIGGGRESVGSGEYSFRARELKPNTTYYYTMCASGVNPDNRDMYSNNDYFTDRLVKGEVQSFTTTSFEAVAVDLGLSVKWASCNVGAEFPREYGGYYAWGETEEKSDYSWSTYKWCNGSNNTLTKYCTDSSYGTVDNKTTLDPEDDVAHVKWGGSWRMPTYAEIKELQTQCTWTWTTLSYFDDGGYNIVDVDGCKVVGPNGNSIFLPAAGYRDGTGVHDSDREGYYSSATHSKNDCAYFFYFRSNYLTYYGSKRCIGRTVRPVTD